MGVGSEAVTRHWVLGIEYWKISLAEGAKEKNFGGQRAVVAAHQDGLPSCHIPGNPERVAP